MTRKTGRYRVFELERKVSELTKDKERLTSENSALRSENRDLNRLALRDPLTGVGNVRALREFVEIEQEKMDRSQREGVITDVACVYFDLDKFKQINDRQGHDAGDTLLKKFAEILKSSTRASDQVFRVGGDEFVVILPISTEKSHSEAMAYVQRIYKGVEEVEGLETSSGVCTLREAGGKITVMIGTADGSMLRLKRERRQ